MNILISNSELQNQFQVADFVLKTQKQIVKDFYSSSLYFDEKFQEIELSKNEILEHIQCKLEEIIQIGETQLLQLLYQIDIPQSTFLEHIGEGNFIEKLSDLILRREAYKVYLRSMF